MCYFWAPKPVSLPMTPSGFSQRHLSHLPIFVFNPSYQIYSWYDIRWPSPAWPTPSVTQPPSRLLPGLPQLSLGHHSQQLELANFPCPLPHSGSWVFLIYPHPCLFLSLLDLVWGPYRVPWPRMSSSYFTPNNFQASTRTLYSDSPGYFHVICRLSTKSHLLQTCNSKQSYKAA